MRRIEAHLYRDHGHERMRTNSHVQIEICQLFVIIIIIFMICILEKSNTGQTSTKLQDEQANWIYQSGLILIAILLGFIAVIAITQGLNRQSTEYKVYLTGFFIFLLVNFFMLFIFLSIGVFIAYGDNFNRQLYLLDPKTNSTISIQDDGTYVIKNGVIVGRQSLDKAREKEHLAMRTEVEPALTYVLRLTFVLLLVIALIIVLLTLIAISTGLCISITEKYTGQGDDPESAVEIAMRNGRIMNMMQAIPYSTFLFQQARDCPICLESFRQESQVVQLTCSRYHIFHYHCLKNYLKQGSAFEQKQCPLCRKPLQVQEPTDSTQETCPGP